MSIVLRFILMIASVITFMVIVRKIRNAKVQIETSLFWILFAGALLLLSIFPEIAIWSAEILGIQSPANFIFLFVIFILLFHQFINSLKISTLENKLKELTQELAVRELKDKENGKNE